MNTQLGLCRCGCGRGTNKTPKGEPRRHIRGHNRRGTSVGWKEQGQWYISIDGKKKAFHRYVVEQRERRPLRSDEVVHHIDHDPLNNDPENLAVLSRAEHTRLHRLEDKKKPWTANEKERAATLRALGMIVQEVAWALGRSYFGTRSQLARLRDASYLPGRSAAGSATA
jgi:hypothetical protein